MKKTIIAMVIGGLILGGAVPLLQAKEKPVTIFANFGLMLNGFIIPNEVTLGLQLDYRLNKLLMFSPEFNVWTAHYHFSDLTLAPGTLLNVRFGHFFFGGGVVFMRGGGYGGFGSNGTPRWVTRPKVNLGLTNRHFKLALGAIPIEDGIAGVLSAGIGF
jgi:hypothetical protein